MSHRAGVALAAAVCLLTIAVAPTQALATGVSSAQLQALAAGAANGNGQALVELRAITSVDGNPVDLGVLLGTGPAPELHARLHALAAPGPARTVSAAGARAAAASILSSARYGKATVPDPLLNLLNKLRNALASLAAEAPGGPVAFWAVAAAIVLALALFGAHRMLRRLAPAQRSDYDPGSVEGEDPATLERDAQAAEARGAFSEAVRLRFRAGLLRLGSRDAIDYRPSVLTAEVVRDLDSPEFELLNETFERVAYGGVPADPEDADAAREGWRTVLSQQGGGR